jgi:hypothetical protein
MFRIVATRTVRSAMRGLRGMGHASATPVVPLTEVKLPEGVVVPEIVPTLEWLLDCPPNLHEFEEAPVILNLSIQR